MRQASEVQASMSARVSSRKVMIVDENVLDVMKAETALRRGGYEIVKMSTPHGVLAKLDYERPEILLLDVTMTRLNMRTLLETLRTSPEHEDLIIVLFSDLEAEVLQQWCREHDIHGYYCKSMDITRVSEFLDNFYEE